MSLENKSTSLKIIKGEGDRENDLAGVWNTRSSEWHHKMGKIIKKLQSSAVENIKDEKIGTKVVGTHTD